MSACLLALYTCVPIALADYAVNLDRTAWKASPGWTRPTAAREYSHSFANGIAAFKASGDGGTMIWARQFSPSVDITHLRYVTIRYRTRNINPELRSYFLYLSSPGDNRMRAEKLALGAKDLVADGRWHRVTTQLRIHGALATAAIRFQALPGKEAIVEIAQLAFTAQPPRFPIAESLPWRPGADTAVGKPIALAATLKTPLPQLQHALALSDWFSAERVVVDHVPFRVFREGAVALSTPVKEKQAVSIRVRTAARDVYLLMGAQLSYRILTYDGWQPGDSIDQPERFSIRVVYVDGTSDVQLPYCLDKGEHAIWRGLHVYEIATEDKPIDRIDVRDGMVTAGFHLVALTAGAKRLAPPTVRPRHRTPTGFIRPDIPPKVSGTTLMNGAGAVSIGPANGLAISSIRGQLGVEWRLRAVPMPLFTVREGGRVWSAKQFRHSRALSASPTSLEYHGTCEDAQMAARVRFEPRKGNEFALSLAVKNLAVKTRFAAIVFPQVALKLDSAPDDLWYLLPRSCAVLGNDNRVFRTGYGGKFPVQWMDFYDVAKGGGVYLATRTRSVQHRWYEGGKQGGLAVAKVEYLDNVPLPPNEWVEYPPAVIGIHPGDWHAAFNAYRRWRASWYEPMKPRLDWFRRIWHLRTHWIRTLPVRGVAGNPEYNWLDPTTHKLRALRFLKKDRDAFGYVDYIHIFDWRVSDKYGRWGDYSHYDESGGLAEFRRAIKALQNQGIRVGLYMDTFLCSRKSLVGQAHGREWALARQDGRLGHIYSAPNDPVYDMCVSHPGWQDYLARTAARVARETGCDGIYLDEGGMNLPQYWCWRKDHGHPVPATTIAGERTLFEKVKAALPNGVALYTEYCPPDALIPYLDGAYMASLRWTNLHYSPGYLNLSRFAFPDFKVFVIASGGSMIDGIYDGLKYSLFNGVALYTLAWGHDANAFELCAKLSRILKKHEGAFCTLNPRPFVPTGMGDVYCNEFPGKRETVWTLWNGRFRTVRGVVLRVPHAAGARYRDVWNKRHLSPKIEDGKALIETSIGPRDVGVVVQVRQSGKSPRGENTLARK